MECCDERVCLCAHLCILYVCLRAYLRDYTSDLHKINVHVTCGRDFAGFAVRYVLPVLRMTSYLHAIGHMAGGLRYRCSE